MAETHDLGPIFVHSIWLKEGAPLAHTAPTNELEEPYRRSKSLIIRLPFTNRGAVFGWWRKTGRDEEEALREAVTSVNAREGFKHDARADAVESLPALPSELVNGNDWAGSTPLPQIAREVPGSEVIIEWSNPQPRLRDVNDESKESATQN